MTHFPAFSNSPRAVSPELKRSYSPVSTYRDHNGHNVGTSPNRTGALSPVSTLRHESTVRSASPLKSEFGSPTVLSPADTPARGFSPMRGGGHHVARHGNAFAQQEDLRPAVVEQQKALAALQGQAPMPNTALPGDSLNVPGAPQKDRQRLSLVTQISPPVPGGGKQGGGEDEEEEEEEQLDVIAMSPATNAPIMRYRQSRSSMVFPTSISSSANPSSSQVNLNGMNVRRSVDTNRPYFGQNVNTSDLVATGLENAFSRL